MSESDEWYDADWDELPEEQLEAAKLLGFTKELWDADEETEITKEYDWADLNDAQKAAAESLGYDNVKWDEE